MTVFRGPFPQFLLSGKNRWFLLLAPLVGLLYFFLLRYLYPIASYYSDSFTWVGGANTGQPVTIRPIAYSKLLMFFKYLSTSEVAVVAAQYFSNLVVNLFLFFTCTFLFNFKRGLQILLYVLLIINPFYLFYSNYISSDAFFCCATVLWFTLLIWIINRASWKLMIAQLLVLAFAFALRYNAIFFPAIAAIAIALSQQTIARKLVGIALPVLVITGLILFTKYHTKKFTGTDTFSAFSGWQLANDALHVLQHDKIDTTTIKDKEVKHFTSFVLHYFDTAKQTYPDSGATAVFMWHPYSPLKRYMTVYSTNRSYFKVWNHLGPVYSKFGKTIILQRPATYLRYFVLPNSKAYLFSSLEIYETYMENRDTMPPIVTKYYKYKSNKTPKHHPQVYSFVFEPMKFLFPVINIMFLVLGAWYMISRKYLQQSKLFNQVLLSFAALFLANIFFIVFLAPSVLRYHIFIITLSFPLLLYMVQQLFTPAAQIFIRHKHLQ
jgi:hypothetical protein